MILRLCFLLVLVCRFLVSTAQFVQYSMLEFASSRTNPAYGPLEEYFSGSLIYRNQRMGQGNAFSTSHLQINYPIEYTRNLRAALMINVLDDRFGIAGIYRNNQFGGSYAMNLQISDYSFLGLGARLGYRRSFVSLNGLNTGSQFIQDRGFVSGSQNEPLGDLSTNYVSGDLGLHWQLTDKDLQPILDLGLAMYDVNKPRISFYDSDNQLQHTWVIHSEFRAYAHDRLKIYPGVFFTTTRNSRAAQLGLRTAYTIGNGRNRNQVELLTRYWTQGVVSTGFTFANDTYSIGCAYDLSVNGSGYSDGFEVAITLKKLTSPRRSRRKNSRFHSFRRRTRESTDDDTLSILTEEEDVQEMDSSEVVDDPSKNRVLTINLGQVTHMRPVEISDTVRFHFPTNQSLIDANTEEVLEVILSFLFENEYVHVTLTGHTDDVGARGYNYRLGLKRVEEIADFLLNHGITQDRIQLKSMGEEEPLLPNNSDGNRAKNRRVDVSFSF